MTTETKTPVIVHCGACQHEWVAVYLPMDATLAAKVMKQRCPMCGGSKVFIGGIPRPTPVGAAHAWLNGNDTGMSSLTIWRVLMGETPERPMTPSDPADFGRCYRLLNVMPPWRARLHEVATAYPKWKPLVDAWDELTALYEKELPSGRCPKLYVRMKQLRGDE